MNHFVLVGAEGAAEVEGQPWIREATRDEFAAWQKANTRTDPITKKEVSVDLVDHTGRPYWLMAVEVDHPDCPVEAATKAMINKRVLRLIE